ncbi:chromosome-associated kinesin KIF4A-like isoform X2 [Babylonia areolata]|uniref:chromosome-associated kinesin KIF4A-like isoform X2 n=1 Tax=Babylonia areolata TaxID=304850 RepID=UPI003FD31A5C
MFKVSGPDQYGMSDQQVIPVRVALRARPLIPREENEGCQTCLWFHPDEPQVILGKDKAFTYDYVFSPSQNQQDVYNKSAQQLVKSIFEGYNATVLAYGQTGSGKTFSMGGCYEAYLSQDEDAMGIIPRILRDLFRGISEKSEYSFRVTVSYLDIYNEELLDLLCPPSQRQSLTLREDLHGEIKIKGLREVPVGSFEDTLQCLSQGAQSRTTGATAMNDTSSRSHAIFTVYIEKSKKDDVNDQCIAKFHLVDLAGSERAKRTRAEGDRFKEGVNINRGLLSLGNVISALGEDVQKRGHIPYRDSKLTRLLQDSLGGNSHTLMVACVSPADSNMEETLNTLRYADRARKIKNKPVINRDPQSDEILRLRQVVQSLQNQLLQKGGGSSDMAVDTTCVKAAGVGAEQELTRLAERTSLLEKENAELTQELERAIDQNTRMCQTVIHLEASVDKLKAKLSVLKEDTGTTCVKAAGVGAEQELTRLAERTSLLEKENAELTQELERAIDQNTRMCQTVIHLEASVDKLKAKLSVLKEDTGVNFDLLTCSLAADSSPQVMEDVDRLRRLTESLREADREEEDHDLAAEEETEEDSSQIHDDLSSPDSRAKSTEHVLRQAKMSRELQELNQILAKKQDLANQMSRSEGEITALRSHYETMMKEWQSKVAQLQKEKEELSVMLTDTHTTDNTSKVSEQRRKRLQELETEMSSLKRKIAEQAKTVKLKEQSQKQVNHLNSEILALKQQRVKLMKQMKEEGDQWRKWKQQKDKEVLQLMQKDRKRQAELAKLQQTSEKQKNVLKRKVEEAAAANRRLKEALLRQKAVANERAAKADQSDTTSVASRVRKWLSEELEVRVSVREARYHMMALITDRKDLSQQRRELQDRLEGPLAKKYSCEDETGATSEKSFEEEAVRKQIEVLSTEIELRNVQIQDLQQKICDADQEMKTKSMWESLHTMVEAKCALKWLLEQAVDGKADCTTLQEELKAAKEANKENKEAEEELEEKIERLERIHQEELLQLKQEHQQKTLFLLGMGGTKKSEETCGDEALRKKLDIQAAELSKMSAVVEELEKKSAECEELRRRMTGMMYDGKIALMPSITDPDSSPFRTPRPKPQFQWKAAGVKKMPPVPNTPETPGGSSVETDDDCDNDDEDNDPNWRLTPFLNQRHAKRTSGSQCGCKSDCSTKRCSCNRGGRRCAAECGCEDSVCQNKPPDTTVSSSSSSVMNSTVVIESGDGDSQVVKAPPRVLRTLTNKKTTRSSKTKLLDLIHTEQVRSSDEFEKPTPIFMKPGKRTGQVTFIESEEFKTENSKRRRTILSTKNLSYFSLPK